MPVHFFSADLEFALDHPRKTSKWIAESALKEKSVIKEISYVFCTDDYLLKLNQDFLQHNTLTDIITFDYSLSKKILEGEIYISIERIKENAIKFKRSFDEELHRVIIHGVLHLIGYKDKKSADKALMRKKEEAYLSLRQTNVPRGTKSK
jgi:probable rRNA maturation factor